MYLLSGKTDKSHPLFLKDCVCLGHKDAFPTCSLPTGMFRFDSESERFNSFILSIKFIFIQRERMDKIIGIQWFYRFMRIVHVFPVLARGDPGRGHPSFFDHRRKAPIKKGLKREPFAHPDSIE